MPRDTGCRTRSNEQASNLFQFSPPPSPLLHLQLFKRNLPWPHLLSATRPSTRCSRRCNSSAAAQSRPSQPNPRALTAIMSRPALWSSAVRGWACPARTSPSWIRTTPCAFCAANSSWTSSPSAIARKWRASASPAWSKARTAAAALRSSMKRTKSSSWPDDPAASI